VGSPVRGSAALLTVRHSVTHHRITLDVFRCDSLPAKRAQSSSELAWRRPDELDALPMPAPDRRIAKHLRAVASTARRDGMSTERFERSRRSRGPTRSP
jgi:hypothetical protein